MSATLMETGAPPRLPCDRCQGQGFVAATVPGRDWFAGTVDVDCPSCEGTGAAACESCGDAATVRYLRQSLCVTCAPAEEHRFSSCSICEREIDTRERSLPLCGSCEATAQVAGQQAADATRYARERVA